MNTIELRQEIINRISVIDDFEFLRAIKIFLDFKKKEPYIDLTEDQEKELLLAKEDGEKGNYITLTEIDKKVEEWLKER